MKFQFLIPISVLPRYLVQMFVRLLLLFTVVPLVELFLLVEIGGLIGVAPTVAIVIVTGIPRCLVGAQAGFERS